MPRFLANENVPMLAVDAARAAGYDVEWIVELAPSIDDELVLARARTDNRVLLTFDKDFGELAFRRGITGCPGIVLLRTRLESAESLARFLPEVLKQNLAWEGNFCVAQAGRIRVVPLPK